MPLITRQVFIKFYCLAFTKMPRRRRTKPQSSAKNTASKTGTQKTKPPPRKAPSKTSSAVISSSTTGRKRTQGESSEGPREKRSRTRPLTAADIPDIVSAVVQAMPQPTETSTTRTPRRTPSRRKKNTEQPEDQPSGATRQRATRATTATETDDSSDDQDADNEDFGKLCSYPYSVWFFLWVFDNIVSYNAHHANSLLTHTPTSLCCILKPIPRPLYPAMPSFSQGLKAHCLLCPILQRSPRMTIHFPTYNNWNLIQQMFQALTVTT